MAKLSVARAAAMWEAAKRDEAKVKADLDLAGDVLKQYFRRTGRSDYKGRISFAVLSRLQLDNDAVKRELGDRLPDFQRRITYEQLSLLK
jgi:hypothetical protein